MKEVSLRKHKDSIDDDWDRVLSVWSRIKNAHFDPSIKLFEDIYEMRKVDRGIDYPLRRLLGSEKYKSRIRVYGGTSSSFGRHPFRWDGKHWLLIRVKGGE